MSHFDVIIVGGGPAGLSAALVLGRCRRSVLICDQGRPRNMRAHAMHCFPSRDGCNPLAFLRRARSELRRYSSVTFSETEVIDAQETAEGFQVRLHDHAHHQSTKLLLASGVVDLLPPIAGFERFYGTSVHHCPYCDAWEHRDQRIAVYGRAKKGIGLALMLTLWSRHITLCTDGAAELSANERQRLAEHNIAVHEERIARLDGTHQLERIVFFNKDELPCEALFFNTGQYQRSPLLERLGCEFTDKGGAVVDELSEQTNIRGLYVAGDASRDVQLIVVAAAEGVKAAFAINRSLLRDRGLLA